MLIVEGQSRGMQLIITAISIIMIIIRSVIAYLIIFRYMWQSIYTVMYESVDVITIIINIIKLATKD